MNPVTVHRNVVSSWQGKYGSEAGRGRRALKRPASVLAGTATTQGGKRRAPAAAVAVSQGSPVLQLLEGADAVELACGEKYRTEVEILNACVIRLQEVSFVAWLMSANKLSSCK